MTTTPVTTSTITTSTMAQITLATTDPVAAIDAFNTDTQNLLEDSFAQFLRTSRGSRPLSSPTTAPTGLSPRVYGLSPRLPSALPPSASPRIVEPVTPDRQQPVGTTIPFWSGDDIVDLPSSEDIERARERRRKLAKLPKYNPPGSLPVDVVEEDKMDDIFNNLPRKPAPPPLNMSAPEPRQSNEDKLTDAMTLALPTELPPIAKSSSLTAPMSWAPARCLMATPSPLAPSVREPSPLALGRSELQLPCVNTIPNPVNIIMDRPNSRHTSPMPLTFPRFGDPLTAPSGPTSSISDADSHVTERRPPRRPHPESTEDLPSKKIIAIGVDPPICLPVQPITRDIDPLRCSMCTQRFARRSNLFKHLRSVHEEKRRFPCPTCKMTFKRKDHLIKHIRSVHAKLRKYSCDICGIGFAEKFNRDKHRRSIHETKRAFQCPCGAYFQDRDKTQNCLRCKKRDSTL